MALACLDGDAEVHPGTAAFGFLHVQFPVELLDHRVGQRQAHAQAISAVTKEEVASVANTLSYHSSFLLKGAGQ